MTTPGLSRAELAAAGRRKASVLTADGAPEPARRQPLSSTARCRTLAHLPRLPRPPDSSKSFGGKRQRAQEAPEALRLPGSQPPGRRLLPPPLPLLPSRNFPATAGPQSAAHCHCSCCQQQRRQRQEHQRQQSRSCQANRCQRWFPPLMSRSPAARCWRHHLHQRAALVRESSSGGCHRPCPPSAGSRRSAAPHCRPARQQ